MKNRKVDLFVAEAPQSGPLDIRCDRLLTSTGLRFLFMENNNPMLLFRADYVLDVSLFPSTELI